MQIAVILKDQAWTIMRDAAPLGSGVTRSAAMEIAHALRFQAEAQGQTVEFVVQETSGTVTTRFSGGA